MRNEGEFGDAACAASAIDWWTAAGVDVLVDEAPRDWLAPSTARVAAPASATSSTPVAAHDKALPTDLAAFQAWLLASPDVPLAGPPALRVGPAGNPAGGLAVVTDMAEPEDRAADQLLSGAVGRLVDRILAALGRDRASAYLLPLVPGRPPNGRIDAASLPRLAEIARTHIALAAPRMVVAFGDAASCALAGDDLSASRGTVHSLDLGSGTVPLVTTFHPRFLLQHPAAKAHAWRDLQPIVDMTR